MANGCGDRVLNEDYADFLITFEEDLEALKSKLDVCVTQLNYNTAVFYTPIASLPKNFFQLYGYSAYPNCYGLLDISSAEASGISKIRGIANLNLRGQGVLVGILDTGIDYTHNAFRNADGTSKIYSIWDQTIQTENGAPEGFSFGTEYKNEKINQALTDKNPLSIVPSTDTDGHGTCLAGIATGNVSEENNFTGIAPDAELVIVKLKGAKQFIRDFWRIPSGITCFQKNDLMFALKYLVDTAAQAKRPISIAIGIGTSQGAHDERGALSSYISTLSARPGVAITIAAGNEGNRGHHYFGTVEKGMEYDTVELKVGPNESGFSMEFWGQTPFTFSFDILSPSGEYIPRIPARLNESREIHFIFEKTIINVDYQIIESQSGDQLILVRFTNPAEGIWRFRVYSTGNLTLQYHVWLPIHQFITEETYFIKPDSEVTLTSPGNNEIPLVVTAYNHNNDSLYLNASKGYTRNGNISPSLAAPGVTIIAPALNNTYKSATGTSVSVAHTAGVAALILEWGIVKGNNSQISTVQIKNLLIRGARRDPSLTYPNKEWGYGILDLYNAYNTLRSY